MVRYKVAVVGATGAVGRLMLRILEERNFPVSEVCAYASVRSAGKEIDFYADKIKVIELKKSNLTRFDFALFSAGAGISKEWAPEFVKHGAVVIDNSRAFRMDPEVPLVVPEVNPEAAFRHRGIIANPNCSTIQLVVVLHPIHLKYGLKRVVVSTYQSVSGTGLEAIEELTTQVRAELSDKEIEVKVYPKPIAFNILPHIDIFMDNGYTREEMKVVRETRKIMNLEDLRITATAVRVPVFISHAESVNIETEKKFSIPEVREILAAAPGIIVEDDPESIVYPTPRECAGRDEVFVGRIRKDVSVPNGMDLWIVADNLRKGAATNAVQIAELLAKK